MERRRYKRVNLFTSAFFGKESEEKKSYGVVTDVSFAGVFIQTNMLLDVGDRIWIDVKVNGAEIRLKGDIVRKKIVENPALVKYGKGGLGIFVDYMHPHVTDYINGRLFEEIKQLQP